MTIQRVTGKSTRLRREPAPVAGDEVYFEDPRTRRLEGPFRVTSTVDAGPGVVVLQSNWREFRQPTSTLWVLDEGEEAR